MPPNPPPQAGREYGRGRSEKVRLKGGCYKTGAPSSSRLLTAPLVREFNPDVGTLHIRTGRSGKGRHMILHEEGIELFRALTIGRDGIELLLRKADGNPWDKGNQTRPMAKACARAKIEPPATFHALRHTYASAC